MFGVGQFNASCLGIFFLNMQLLIVFWKIQVALRRTYKFNSSGPAKASAVCLLLQLLLGLG